MITNSLLKPPNHEVHSRFPSQLLGITARPCHSDTTRLEMQSVRHLECHHGKPPSAASSDLEGFNLQRPVGNNSAQVQNRGSMLLRRDEIMATTRTKQSTRKGHEPPCRTDKAKLGSRPCPSIWLTARSIVLLKFVPTGQTPETRTWQAEGPRAHPWSSANYGDDGQEPTDEDNQISHQLRHVIAARDTREV